MMRPKQAKSELRNIMKQKTVSISRLKKILDVLDYEELERKNIRHSELLMNQKRENKQLHDKIKNQKEELRKWKEFLKK